MAQSYKPGQAVRLVAGGLEFTGIIRELSLTSALLAFKLPFEASPTEVLWPDGRSSTVDLRANSALAELTMRVSLPGPLTQELEPIGVSGGSGAELRRTIRVDIAIPVRVADPHTTGSLVSGQTINLSAGGIEVLLDGPLMVGREYVCQLELTGETMLVRAKPIRRTGHNTYALRFLATPELGHRLMRRVFSMMRTGTVALKRPHMNFRKS